MKLKKVISVMLVGACVFSMAACGSKKEEAKKIAEKLSKILLKIPVKAGENGKIFGGVSAKEVSDLLKEEYKIEVDKKKIELKETIKTLGVRTLTIKLYEGVIGNLKIDVISK